MWYPSRRQASSSAAVSTVLSMVDMSPSWRIGPRTGHGPPDGQHGFSYHRAMAGMASPITVHAAGHFHYRHSWTTERRDPDDHLVMWVVGGSMDLALDGKPCPAAPGDLVLLPPGIAHRYRPTSEDWEWLWLHCDGDAVLPWWQMVCPDS